MEADPVRGLHLSEAFVSGSCLHPVPELFPLLSRADVSTVCCLRILVNLVSLSPMEACLNHGNEIFRRPDPPDFGALGGRAPDSGLVTDIALITSHTRHPRRRSKKRNLKISLHHFFSHFSSSLCLLAMTTCRRMSLATLGSGTDQKEIWVLAKSCL